MLMFSPKDLSKQSTRVFHMNGGLEKLYAMVRYASFSSSLSACRRVMIGRYFGEVLTPSQCKGMCDNCCQRQIHQRRSSNISNSDDNEYYTEYDCAQGIQIMTNELLQSSSTSSSGGAQSDTQPTMGGGQLQKMKKKMKMKKKKKKKRRKIMH